MASDEGARADAPLPFVHKYPRMAATEQRVPPLTDLALDALANNPGAIVNLAGTAEHLAIGLLWRIMRASAFRSLYPCG